MSMFNDISWGSKDNKKACESNAQPGSEKKWYSTSEDSPQGQWARTAEQMIETLAESGHPVFRATSPLSRGVLKTKVVDNCRSTIVPTRTRLQLFFAQLLL